MIAFGKLTYVHFICLFFIISEGLSQSSSDNERTLMYLQQAQNYANPTDQKSIYRAALREKLSPTDTILLKYLHELAIVYGKTTDLDSCQYFFEKLLIEAEQQHSDYYQSVSRNGLGNIYRMHGLMEDALENFLPALRLAEKINNQTWLGIVLTNVAGVYHDTRDYSLTLYYTLKAEKIFRDIKDTINIAHANNVIAITYIAMRDFESAKKYNDIAISINTIKQDTAQLMYSYVNTASILEGQERYNQAIYIREQVAKMAADFQELELLVSNFNSIAELYIKLGNTKKAQEYARRALEMAVERNLKPNEASSYHVLFQIALIEKDYITASRFKNVYDILVDSIRSRDMREKLAELNVKYETEKKLSEIEQLNIEREKDNNQKLFLFILAILLIITAILIFRMYQLKTKTNTELLTLNRTKDRFLGLIAHDIKNPLSAFRSITESLKTNFDTIAQQDMKYYLGRLHESSLHLNELLQNLLEWSISQTGNLKFSLENLNLRMVTTEAMLLFKQSAEAKNTQLINDVPQQLVVSADYKMLLTILRNLISNAIKFTPKEGIVRIWAIEKSKMIEITVSDTGIGIPEKHLKGLFDIRNDVSKVGNSKEKGTGLGLVLCREFVDKNGGRIWVESQEGIGSKFIFTLPIPTVQN